jgi:hypothetical protein
MSKRTANLIGLIITILAGTYFYVMYCGECRPSNGVALMKLERPQENQKEDGDNFKKATIHYYALNATREEHFIGNMLPPFYEEILPVYFDLQN